MGNFEIRFNHWIDIFESTKREMRDRSGVSSSAYKQVCFFTKKLIDHKENVLNLDYVHNNIILIKGSFSGPRVSDQNKPDSSILWNIPSWWSSDQMNFQIVGECGYFGCLSIYYNVKPVCWMDKGKNTFEGKWEIHPDCPDLSKYPNIEDWELLHLSKLFPKKAVLPMWAEMAQNSMLLD